MSEGNAIAKILERLGFTREAVSYMTRACNMDSSDEAKWMDGEDDVGNMINQFNQPGGTVTCGTGNEAVTTPSVGLQVYLRDENNLKLCVYFLKHMEMVHRVPTAASITLGMVHGYREQHRYAYSFNKTAVEPEINDKDWPRFMESIREYLAAQYGAKGSTLDYVIRQEVEVKPHAPDPSDNCNTVVLEMTAQAPHTGRTFQDDKRKVWDILSNMCAKHPCWVYIKPAQIGKNGRLAYELIFEHYLGPNNVGNMANADGTKLSSTLYNGEKKRFTWETYVSIHTEQHSVLNGLKGYGYTWIDDSSKVRHPFKVIKTTELDVCKSQVMDPK
jgi:hypothetical protein